MNQPESNGYFVFVKQGYDRAYYCVAGRDIKLEDAVCYLFQNEAAKVCTTMNMELNDELRQKETLDESRSTSQGKSSP
jgi:ribosomal protein L9